MTDVLTETLAQILAQAEKRHNHVCPRQVIGARMGLWASELLDLELPQPKKQLLAIVETDGCFTTGVSLTTNCWVHRRTMRVEDYGKIAVTFVDTKRQTAIRMAPHPNARQTAHDYAADASNRWETMLLGYQRMPTEELIIVQHVELTTPLKQIISRAGHRVSCERCGEEIINEREVIRNGETLCLACVGEGYYRVTARERPDTCIQSEL